MSVATETKAILRPLADRIILRRDEAKGFSDIIATPDSSKEVPARGTVVAVGPGLRNRDGERVAVAVKPGDRVLFAKFAGDEVDHDGEALWMLRESDVMAVIEGE